MMSSKSSVTQRLQKQTDSKTQSRLLIELCKNKEVDAGRWVEFSTSKVWKKIKSPPRSIKVRLELRAVNDVKPRRIKLTVDHRPILEQSTAFPNKKNKFSAEIGQLLSHGDELRLKIEGSRFFKWMVSLELSVKKGRSTTQSENRTRPRNRQSSKMQFCLNCGSLLLIEAKFCHRCGTKI